MAVEKKKPVLSDKSKPSTREEKEKALTAAMGQIEKAFGKGAIMRLGDGSHLNVEMVPTGSLGLDIAWAVVFRLGVSLKFTAQSHRVKLRWRFLQLPAHSVRVDSVLSLMRSMLLIPDMHSN